MPAGAQAKRAIAYVDGQNLFNAVKETWGYDYPNYDVKALAGAVCVAQGWQLGGVHFYTGVPLAKEDFIKHHFWAGKFREMTRQGVHVFRGHLRYHQKTIELGSGLTFTATVPTEKGIDVRYFLM